jgi:hypothetical protein
MSIPLVTRLGNQRVALDPLLVASTCDTVGLGDHLVLIVYNAEYADVVLPSIRVFGVLVYSEDQVVA